MKTKIRVLLLSFVAMYVCGLLIEAEFDISAWDKNARIALACTWSIGYAIWLAVTSADQSMNDTIRDLQKENQQLHDRLYKQKGGDQ
jgi:hypothetical protein